MVHSSHESYALYNDYALWTGFNIWKGKSRNYMLGIMYKVIEEEWV